jgi:hypothetical protein
MSYREIILEGVPSGEEQHARPVLPDDYLREHIACIPRIPLPNGRFVFYMKASSDVVEQMTTDSRLQSQIIANSWIDLFFGHYQYWDWVFDVDVTEYDGQKEYRIRRKLAQTTGQEIHGIYVPGIFQGDTVPEFQMPEFIIESYQRLRSDTQLILPTISGINDVLLNRVRRNPKELHNIKPREFEELICDLLTSHGWDIELTPESKDGGYDIIGFSGISGGVKTSWIIECKRYTSHRKIGVDIVRSICGVKEQIKVANAMIVTTSTFTRGAQQMSHNRLDLSLRDYNNILEWISDPTKGYC